MKLIETPEVKSKINEAFGAAARQLGMKEMDKEMITAMISHLSNELAYIEALRDKVAGYLMIKRKIKDLQTAYRNDRRVAETLERVAALITAPFNKLREQFQLVDAQTAEVMSSLRQLTATVQFLRGIRDELREFVLLWHDLDAAWAETRVMRGSACEAMVARTYRFVATHYSMTQRWAMNVA
jgi:DNA repair exonuclease SbcCD ATPase subunit